MSADRAAEALAAASRLPGVGVLDHGPQIDMTALRGYRLRRLQAELTARDCPAALLYDPVNIRYATGCRNMQLWARSSPARYAFVPADGRAVAFEYRSTEHLARGLETIAEVRPAIQCYFMSAGSSLDERVEAWAGEVDDLLRAHAGENRRLAVDGLRLGGAEALRRRGVELVDADPVLQLARAIKSAEEIACLVASVAIAETAMARLRDALAPGRTENALWAILNETNCALGGEWIDTRLLTSGGRTNPWYQEASDKLVRAGELVAFDTDMIGRFGYEADVSRTYFCPPGRPTGEQRTLYGLAHEQVQHNLSLIRPGVSFREFSERSWRAPEEYAAQTVGSVIHGVGFGVDYPQISRSPAYDGVFEEGMTVCVESYIGAVGGREGVKLEEQVLVTATGIERLSTFPYEEDLLA